VIICPSESCYGFSCNARNKEAIKIIHQIKQEPQDKPLTLAISDISQIKEFGVVNEKTQKIAAKLFPAQLNLIISENQPNNFSFLTKSGISFRIPNHKILSELAKAISAPIVTTSANLHNQPPSYNIAKIKELFEDKVDFILDGGDLDENNPTSTIYDTRTNKILRQGIVTLDQIQEALK